MKVGFYDDGRATRKVEIIDETISGMYVCRRIVALFMGFIELIPKDKVVDIKEEE